MWQEGFCHEEGPVEIDIHNPFNRSIVQVVDPDKGLYDSGIVDDPVHSAVPGDHLFGEGGDCVSVRDIHDMRGQSIFFLLRQASRLLQPGFVDIYRRDARAPGEQVQDQLSSDPVPAPCDNNHFILNFHLVILR